MGRQVAILPAGAVPRDLDRARRMAVVDAARVRRLAADLRSAVADVLAAARPAGGVQFRDQPAGVRRGDLRLSGARRHRHHPVLPRPRLACRRRRGGGARVCDRRRRQRAHPAYRPGHQPRLSAAGRSGCSPARSNARPGAPASPPARLPDCWRSAATRWRCCASTWSPATCWPGGSPATGVARPPARELAAALRRRRERRAGGRGAGHHDRAAGGALEPSRGQLRVGRRRLDPSGASAATRLRRSVRRDGPQGRLLGAVEPASGRPSGARPISTCRRTCRWFTPARCRSWPSSRSA